MKALTLLLLSYFIFFSARGGEEIVPKDSLYQVKSVWTDQNGRSVHLKEFAGQKTIITMVYTSCPHSCPTMIKKLRDIEKSLNESGAKKYQIALASFDPKKDTPVHLKNYMKKMNLDETRWTMLSPPKDAIVRELAAVLEISYKDLGDGDYSHSNVIVLLDEKGRPISRLESLSSDIAPMIKKAVGDGK